MADVPARAQPSQQHEPACNCPDNAFGEGFFHQLKREGRRRQIYTTRNDGRGGVFNAIETCYGLKPHHTAGDTSPVAGNKSGDKGSGYVDMA